MEYQTQVAHNKSIQCFFALLECILYIIVTGCKFTCWIRGVRVRLRLRRGRLLHRVWCFIRSLVVKFYHQDFGSEHRAAPLVRARSREVRSGARFHHKDSRLLMWWRIIDGAARALWFQTEALTSVKHTRLQKKASNELVKKNSVRHKMSVVLIHLWWSVKEWYWTAAGMFWG